MADARDRVIDLTTGEPDAVGADGLTDLERAAMPASDLAALIKAQTVLAATHNGYKLTPDDLVTIRRCYYEINARCENCGWAGKHWVRKGWAIPDGNMLTATHIPCAAERTCVECKCEKVQRVPSFETAPPVPSRRFPPVPPSMEVPDVYDRSGIEITTPFGNPPTSTREAGGPTWQEVMQRERQRVQQEAVRIAQSQISTAQTPNLLWDAWQASIGPDEVARQLNTLNEQAARQPEYLRALSRDAMVSQATTQDRIDSAYLASSAIQGNKRP